MAFKDILEQAVKKRGPYDHIGWRGICRRCGLNYNIFADECKRMFGDVRAEVRNKNIQCKHCKGSVKILYKMSGERAVHLNSIRRRGSSNLM